MSLQLDGSVVDCKIAKHDNLQHKNYHYVNTDFYPVY